MSYHNPIIPGFYPDPSVCRVGEDYYLVTSSFEYFPGVPVFHSRDMVNWRQIGHCLTRRNQLNLEQCGASAGVFAPTIRYHDGRFYMITTVIHDKPHFYVWTEDPAGPWSDPIRVDQSGIDPSLCFDEEGVVYVTSTGKDAEGQAAIAQSTIDIETGRIVEPTRPVWRGTGGSWPEAPHLFRIGGVWYLMLAEGGTEYGHMVTIGRSDSPWGPFESAPHNPILSHRSQVAMLHCTGHADLIQDHLGGWWMVFLATRSIPRNAKCHHLGRETCLAPVLWEDGWPIVNGGRNVPLEMDVETLPLSQFEPLPPRDDFNSTELALYWNYLRNPREADTSLTERPGYLRLHGSPVTLDELDSPAWIGRRQQHFSCRFSVKMDFLPSLSNEEAGITAYMNNRHHYDLGVRASGKKCCVFVRQRIGPLQVVMTEVAIPDGATELAIVARENEYEFFCNGQKLPVTGEARYLSAEVAKGFTGVYLAMYATGNGRVSGAAADFDWCEYLPIKNDEK